MALPAGLHAEKNLVRTGLCPALPAATAPNVDSLGSLTRLSRLSLHSESLQRALSEARGGLERIYGRISQCPSAAVHKAGSA